MLFPRKMTAVFYIFFLQNCSGISSMTTYIISELLYMLWTVTYCIYYKTRVYFEEEKNHIHWPIHMNYIQKKNSKVATWCKSEWLWRIEPRKERKGRDSWNLPEAPLFPRCRLRPLRSWPGSTWVIALAESLTAARCQPDWFMGRAQTSEGGSGTEMEIEML